MVCWFQIVIGNLLQNRRNRVVLVTLEDETPLVLTPEQEKQGQEIEELIVLKLQKEHEKFISDTK